MNTLNQIDIEIPQSVIDSVMQKLQDCKTDLSPYLSKIDSNQSISFFNTGNKTSVKIDEKTKLHKNQDSEFIVSFMNMVEFFKDESIISKTNPINTLADFFSKQKELTQ